MGDSPVRRRAPEGTVAEGRRPHRHRGPAADLSSFLQESMAAIGRGRRRRCRRQDSSSQQYYLLPQPVVNPSHGNSHTPPCAAYDLRRLRLRLRLHSRCHSGGFFPRQGRGCFVPGLEQEGATSIGPGNNLGRGETNTKFSVDRYLNLGGVPPWVGLHSQPGRGQPNKACSTL